MLNYIKAIADSWQAVVEWGGIDLGVSGGSRGADSRLQAWHRLITCDFWKLSYSLNCLFMSAASIFIGPHVSFIIFWFPAKCFVRSCSLVSEFIVVSCSFYGYQGQIEFQAVFHLYFCSLWWRCTWLLGLLPLTRSTHVTDLTFQYRFKWSHHAFKPI